MSAFQRVGLSVFFLSVVCAVAAAQSPTPANPRSYDAFQAADDSYRNNEAERRTAIDRQIGQQNAVRAYRMWQPYAEAYALPYVYRYGGPAAGMYTHRALERYSSNFGVYAPELRGPRDFFYQPQLPDVRQPIGHEKIWTGPNSYIYKPKYAEPLPPLTAGPLLTPPTAQPAEQQPVPPPIVSPGPSQPETIPPPPLADGPQEF